MLIHHQSHQKYVGRALFAVAIMFAATFAFTRPAAQAQAPAPSASPSAAPPPAAPAAEPAAAEPAAAETKPPKPDGGGLNALSLFFQGGIFMWPLLFMSIVAVTFTIERAIGLRRSKVLPDSLINALGQLGGPQSGFDPRKAYRLCQQFPSATASVIRAMLLKVGRPHSEVEHAVAEASEREAERLYGNVRYLNLATAISPLIGLLGTVQGMIIAFHDTANLPPGVNKSEVLAKGIYVALVTTFAGLCVAIPSAIASHYFEGRIQTMFHQIDELLFNLMPQVERYEGRVRFSRQHGESEGADGSPVPGDARVAAPAPK